MPERKRFFSTDVFPFVEDSDLSWSSAPSTSGSGSLNVIVIDDMLLSFYSGVVDYPLCVFANNFRSHDLHNMCCATMKMFLCYH